MDEKDFAELIASFIKGPSAPSENAQPTHGGKDEGAGDARLADEPASEDEADAGDSTDVEGTNGESTNGESTNGESAQDSHLIIGRKTILESLIDKVDAISNPALQIESVSAELAASLESLEDELPKFDASAISVETLTAAPQDEKPSPESPGKISTSLQEMISTIVAEGVRACAVLATADGLPLASAGDGDFEALAAKTPALLKASKSLGSGPDDDPILVDLEFNDGYLLLVPAGDLALVIAAEKDVGLGLLRWRAKSFTAFTSSS